MIKHLYIPTYQEKYGANKHIKIDICKSINVINKQKNILFSFINIIFYIINNYSLFITNPIYFILII